MQHRSNVSPVPLTVERSTEAVSLQYLDDRVVTYRGPFDEHQSDLTANRSFDVHILVIDPDTGDGIMTYINDYDTSDAILESTGVGRVLIDDGQREVIYPGITATLEGEAINVSIDSSTDDVWVYAFVENDRGESGLILASPSDHCK